MWVRILSLQDRMPPCRMASFRMFYLLTGVAPAGGAARVERIVSFPRAIGIRCSSTILERV